MEEDNPKETLYEKTNRKQVKRRVFERSGGMMAEDEGIGGELVV